MGLIYRTLSPALIYQDSCWPLARHFLLWEWLHPLLKIYPAPHFKSDSMLASIELPGVRCQSTFDMYAAHFHQTSLYTIS